MAQFEPMDVDNIVSDFDDKENSLQNSNVFPKTHNTEKGVEELDVSELNMKLKYSISPANSPMSKSYTANYKSDSGPNSLNNTVNNDDNLTRSLNSNITNTDILKPPKLPLQALPTSLYTNSDRFSCERAGNITVTISGTDNYDDMSLPSTSSSAVQTPEATTPTKEIPKSDGSPIMRGLKSVLNMFRSSHSPIPPADVSHDENFCDAKDDQPNLFSSPPFDSDEFKDHTLLKETSEDVTIHKEMCHETSIKNYHQSLPASTPISSDKMKDSTKRNSPLKESVVFNDGLERELQWQEETEIFFKHEKIPIHKLSVQSGQLFNDKDVKTLQTNNTNNLNTTVEYMDISIADVSCKSVPGDKKLYSIDTKPNNTEISCIESDNEFLDCETTYTQNKSFIIESIQVNKTTPVIFQMNNIVNEVCHEDYIECAMKTSNTNNDNNLITELVPSEIREPKSLSFNQHAYDDNVTEDSEHNLKNDDSMKAPINNIENLHIDHTNDNIINHNVNNNIKPANRSNSIIEHDDVDEQFIGIIEVNNIPDKTAYSISAVNESNFFNNDLIINAENTINLDTDNINTTQLLFDIDALLLNKLNSNYENDIALNYNDNTSGHVNANISRNNEFSETEALDEIVPTIHNATTTEVIVTPVEEKIKCNIVTDSDKNEVVDKYNVLDIIISEDKTIENKDSLHCSDTKNRLSEINCFTSDVNSKMVSDFNVKNNGLVEESITQVQHLKIDEGVMENLELHLDSTNDLPTNGSYEPCEILSEIVQTMELKNTDLPLPSDVSLPGDVDIEKNIILDPCFKEHSIDFGLSLNIESVETTCDLKNENDNYLDYKNTLSLSNQSQIQDNIILNTNHDETTISDSVQINSKSGLEMSASGENLTDIQELNLVSINEKPLVVTEKITQSFGLNKDNHTDTRDDNQQQTIITESVFPNVLQTVSNQLEKHDFTSNENEMDISEDSICLKDNMETDVLNEEILTSENNSPYVSVTNIDSNIIVEEKPLVEPQPKKVASPPISPKCVRKGYNINFDDIDNPFATKTNIRMSPTPETLQTSFTPINDSLRNINVLKKTQNTRMCHSEGKKPGANKKRFNTSIDRAKLSDKTKRSSIKIVNTTHTEDNKTDQDVQKETNSPIKTEVNLYIKYNKTDQGINDDSLPSSLEEREKDTSTLIKASTDLDIKTSYQMSNEIISTEPHPVQNNMEPKSVFNIPEIDDMNFNPFVTKSRVCVTPPPSNLELHNFSNTENNNKIQGSGNISEEANATVCIKDTELPEIKVLPTINNTTSSSINSDKNLTTQEVNTEDDDTVEGPFLEAEDLVDTVKVPEIVLEKNTIQFILPEAPNNEDDKNELFIDAEAFEFLLNQNKSNVVSDSGKESLFLKFDPLFAKRVSSDGVLAALSSIQKKQSTPKKLIKAPLVNLLREETTMVSEATTSNVISIPEGNDEEISIVSNKPMMVVTPAVAKQPVATPRASLTPKTNRQSLNFTSPAMSVIDRLLSLSPSLLNQGVSTDDASRNDANIVLVQLRELLAEKELHVHDLKCESKELKDRLTTLESHVKSLENESEERLRKVNNLNEVLAEKTNINKSMSVVVEEYERTIAVLIADIEQEKKNNAEERMKLISERDEQTVHLTSMESSFNDLHSKYEKCKQVILSMKANEDAYKKSFKDFDENLQKMQKNYDLLKQHATSKLNHANQELENINRTHDAEVLKLTAMIKRKDLHITSLEESLTQKNKAIEELSAICDELINKVG